MFDPIAIKHFAAEWGEKLGIEPDRHAVFEDDIRKAFEVYRREKAKTSAVDIRAELKALSEACADYLGRNTTSLDNIRIELDSLSEEALQSFNFLPDAPETIAALSDQHAEFSEGEAWNWVRLLSGLVSRGASAKLGRSRGGGKRDKSKIEIEYAGPRVKPGPEAHRPEFWLCVWLAVALEKGMGPDEDVFARIKGYTFDQKLTADDPVEKEPRRFYELLMAALKLVGSNSSIDAADKLIRKYRSALPKDE